MTATDFELANLACGAAIELDNARLGRATVFPDVNRLADWLHQTFPEGATSCVDPNFVGVLYLSPVCAALEAVAQDNVPLPTTVESVVRLVRRWADYLAGLADAHRYETKAVAFCLALSEAAGG